MRMWSHRLPAPLAGPSPAAYLLGWTCLHPPPAVGAADRPRAKYVRRSVRCGWGGHDPQHLASDRCQYFSRPARKAAAEASR